jgi:hypothetical protein
VTILLQLQFYYVDRSNSTFVVDQLGEPGRESEQEKRPDESDADGRQHEQLTTK